MNYRLITCLGLVAAWITAGPSFAGTTARANDADVCYSPSFPFTAAGSAPADKNLTDQTEFNCPRAGKKTLPQLAQAGWRIVSVTMIEVSSPESIPGKFAWVLVIERLSH